MTVDELFTGQQKSDYLCISARVAGQPANPCALILTADYLSAIIGDIKPCVTSLVISHHAPRFYIFHSSQPFHQFIPGIIDGLMGNGVVF